jgi:hypothetical protein
MHAAMSKVLLQQRGGERQPSVLCACVQEWVKVSGTKKVNRFQPPEVREALVELELARERLQLAADQVYSDLPVHCLALLSPPYPQCIVGIT